MSNVHPIRPHSSTTKQERYRQKRAGRAHIDLKKVAYFLEKYPTHIEEPNAFIDSYKFSDQGVQVDELVNAFIKTYPENVFASVGDRYGLSARFSQRLKNRVAKGELDFTPISNDRGSYRTKLDFEKTELRKNIATPTVQTSSFATHNDLARVEEKVDKLTVRVEKTVLAISGQVNELAVLIRKLVPAV